MSMKISVTGKNMKITEALKDYIKEKLGKLETHFESAIMSAHATCIVEKDRHIVDINIQTTSTTVHVTEESEDLYKSVDAACDVVMRKVRKLKEKMVSRRKEGKGTGENFSIPTPESHEDIETSEGYHITVIDRFVKKPMSADEAAIQLDMLNNDFLVFINESNQRVNVIFKRRDGNFGLIDPKL